MSNASDPGIPPTGGSAGDRSQETGSLVYGLKVLLAAELLLAMLILPFGYAVGIDLGLMAVAWLICAVSAVAALIASDYPRGDEFLMLRLVAAMACRTLLPLLFAIWGVSYREPPMERSIVLVLVACYLTGLVVDSVLNLARLTRNQNINKATR